MSFSVSPMSLRKTKGQNKMPYLGKTSHRWFVILTTTFFVFLFGITMAFVTYISIYQDKIFPGVYISGQNVSGLTQNQAYDMINNKKEKILTDGITFSHSGNIMNIPPALVATDPNLARSIISFDISKSVAAAYQYGRSKTFMKNLADQFLARTKKKHFTVIYYLNESELLSIMQLNFNEMQEPPRDAQLSIRGIDAIEVLSEKDGWIFDYEKAINILKFQLNELRSEPIELEKMSKQPTIYASETANAVQKVKEALSTSTPEFFYQDKKWKLTYAELTDWLEFSKPLGTEAQKSQGS